MTEFAEVRSRATKLALFAALVLTVSKLGIGFKTGSAGVLSEGIHSFLDLISAWVAFFTVRHAIRPADESHPFGHGKFETLASLFESLLLVAAGAWIIFESVDHLIDPRPIVHEQLAMSVMIASLVVSFIVYLHNRSAAKITASPAIRANALHFLSDVLSSLGVLVGLTLMKMTGWFWIDGLIAGLVGLYVMLASWEQIRSSLFELTDSSLPQSDLAKIQDVLAYNKSKFIDFHDLRTRKSGVFKHIEFHLTLCGGLSVQQSHDLCDYLESEIGKTIPRSHITIHVEPCSHHNPQCATQCDYKMVKPS